MKWSTRRTIYVVRLRGSASPASVRMTAEVDAKSSFCVHCCEDGSLFSLRLCDMRRLKYSTISTRISPKPRQRLQSNHVFKDKALSLAMNLHAMDGSAPIIKLDNQLELSLEAFCGYILPRLRNRQWNGIDCDACAPTVLVTGLLR